MFDRHFGFGDDFGLFARLQCIGFGLQSGNTILDFLQSGFRLSAGHGFDRKVREGVRIFDDEPVALAAQTVVLVLAGLPQVR
jgi:hypothetical protein